MELEQKKATIEAILFAAGREIKINELMAILELSSDEVISIVNSMQDEYKEASRGIEIIKVEDVCINFNYLYDLTKNLIDINIINYNIDLTRKKTELLAFISLGEVLGESYIRSYSAYCYGKNQTKTFHNK